MHWKRSAHLIFLHYCTVCSVHTGIICDLLRCCCGIWPMPHGACIQWNSLQCKWSEENPKQRMDLRQKRLSMVIYWYHLLRFFHSRFLQLLYFITGAMVALRNLLLSNNMIQYNIFLVVFVVVVRKSIHLLMFKMPSMQRRMCNTHRCVLTEENHIIICLVTR